MATPTDIINTATTNLYIKGRWENFKKMNPFFRDSSTRRATSLPASPASSCTGSLAAGTYAPTITSDYADQAANYVPNKQYILGQPALGRDRAVRRGEQG
jgi:hypothetical protein